MSSADVRAGSCLTCYGSGETGSEWGLSACPDCGGSGALPPRDTLVEWRLRAIERAYLPGEGATAQDVAWLAFELRRARQALTQILALSQEFGQDRAADERLALRLRFLGNDALGLYAAVDASAEVQVSSPEAVRRSNTHTPARRP